jgi:hypothetical protein
MRAQRRAGSGHGGEERVGVREREQRGDMAEAEARDEPRAQRLGEPQRASPSARNAPSRSSGSAHSRLRLPGTMPVHHPQHPVDLPGGGPPFACPVTVFWETTSSGLPGVRPSTDWMRSWIGLVGSFIA